MFVLLRPGKTGLQRHLQNFRTKFDPRAISYILSNTVLVGQLIPEIEICFDSDNASKNLSEFMIELIHCIENFGFPFARLIRF